ncbi:hypothetical protein ACTGZS_12380, partial [Streptococcus suis]
GRVSKVIAVRRRADAIAAVKPKLTTARAILSTIPVRRKAADLFVRIGEAAKRADVERRAAVAVRLMARSSIFAAIKGRISSRRAQPITATADIVRTAAALAIADE